MTDSLANVIVDAQPTTLSFRCPAVRDGGADPEGEAGPNYALYSAPVWPEDEWAQVVTEE